MADEFRDQLAFGSSTNDDEEGLRRLSAQIKAEKVVVELFLRHPLSIWCRHHGRGCRDLKKNKDIIDTIDQVMTKHYRVT